MTPNVANAQLAMLRSYVSHTDGTPCLRRLALIIPEMHDYVGSSLQSLFSNGGLANLTHLTLNYIAPLSLQRLGDVYLANGLSKLQKLKVFFPNFDDKESLEAWLSAVLSSSHKGTALRKLEFEACYCDDEDIKNEVSLAFVDALSNGAFPNLEIICDEWAEEVWDEEVAKAAFLVAMARGALCANTLQSVCLGEVSQKKFEAFKKALPQVRKWKSCVKLVDCKCSDEK